MIQLTLMPPQVGALPPQPFSLDPKTRARGLAGVARARRVLERVRPPEPRPARS